MSATDNAPRGPELTAGIALSTLPDGEPFAGHVGDKSVVLVRRGNDVFAVGGACTHYGGPLADGIVVGDTIRCPWHHACFHVRTGEAVRAPALDPVARWEVTQRDGIVYVTREIPAADGATPEAERERVLAATAVAPERIVIVGSGAAGHAAAEMLRRQGYRGSVTMISADESVPYDRPNLSKDYLAGSAEPSWIPLRPAEFYAEHDIDLVRESLATRVDAAARQVLLQGGERISFDRLLIATGADPIRLPLPGSELSHVHYLRTLADSEAIIKRASSARSAVVMGASFIGLEVAAALRARGLDVHVVAPEAQPLVRVLGAELGAYVRALHERQGIVFHLGQVAATIDSQHVTLKEAEGEAGERIPADIVVIGVGVRPSTTLAESAGAKIDRGVVVDAYLETSVAGIFAAGDIARWPDAYGGEHIRVEHWVVAQRQGQTAARNMLGAREKFTAVPFFWSAHYDTTIRYVGHAEQWDETVVDGDVNAGDAAVAFKLHGKTLAVATVGRDRLALEAEAAMERNDQPALMAMLGSK